MINIPSHDLITINHELQPLSMSHRRDSRLEAIRRNPAGAATEYFDVVYFEVEQLSVRIGFLD